MSDDNLLIMFNPPGSSKMEKLTYLEEINEHFMFLEVMIFIKLLLLIFTRKCVIDPERIVL